MILALDVGGTAVKFGLFTMEGTLVVEREASVCFDQYVTPILITVIREAERFLKETRVSPKGIGISATGQVDDRTGEVIGTNGRIPGYGDTPFRQAFQELFHVPVHVLNDANAAVMGEAFMGRATGCQDVMMMTLGTGVGGGIISGGRLIRGQRGIAGELGHFSIDRNGPCCSCGNRGCFEQYASVTALLLSAREAFPENPPADGKELFHRVRMKELHMMRILDQWLNQVALGLIGLCHIFNPMMVLIGGGVSAQEELLILPLREKVKRGLMPRFAENFQLEAASLGNRAGMLGALKFWLDQENDPQGKK